MNNNLYAKLFGRLYGQRSSIILAWVSVNFSQCKPFGNTFSVSKVLGKMNNGKSPSEVASICNSCITLTKLDCKSNLTALGM